MSTSPRAGRRRPGPGGIRRLVPQSYRAALQERRFVLLLPGFAISAVGNGMSAVAVAWAAVQLAPPDHRGLLVAAALVGFELPAVLGGLVLARLMTGWRARQLIAADCLFRASFLIAIPLADAAGVLSPAVFVLLLAASAIMNAWGRAGQSLLVTELFGDDARLSANALLSSVSWVSMVLGPALAGLLMTVFDATLVIGLDGSTYLVLLAALLLERRVDSSRSGARLPQEGNESAIDALTGIRGLFGRVEIRAIVLLSAAVAFLFGPVEVALPVRLANELGWGSRSLGILWSLFGLGAVLGGLLAPMWRRIPIHLAAVFIAGLWGMSLLLVGLSGVPVLSAASLFVAGMVYGPYPALVATHMQTTFTGSQLAAVVASWGSVMTFAAPMGYLVGGPATGLVGAKLVLLGAGAATLLLAGSVLPSAVRRSQRRPLSGPPMAE